jgi:hypothetical protein
VAEKDFFYPLLLSSVFGTFGALISSRDPMPNKKALFDVGIAGPLAGFFVALPVTIVGIASSEVVSISKVSSGELVSPESPNAVKLEGVKGHEDVIMHVVDSGVPVMGHIGLTPQSINKFGKYKGRNIEEIASEDMGYIKWMRKNLDLDEDMEFTLDSYLG